jgi:mxaJ protein
MKRVGPVLLVALGLGWAAFASGSALTVCADPNNLPFSNSAREGFENKIIELLAKDLHKQIRYVWWAQRRGYVRNTLTEAKCDIWPGVASGVERVATTRPYYRSTYVFVTRASSHLLDLSLNDPRLRNLSIGVQLVGNDANNTPPAHAIAGLGLVSNVRGYMLYGNYARPNPPAAIVSAVASGEVDVAMVWGPLAGYFARLASVPLTVSPIPSNRASPWPMQFDVAMGVQMHDAELLDEVNRMLAREQPAIDAILRRYAVPRAAG